MRLVDQYYLFPGKCFFTGSSDVEKPILDLEHQIEGEGAVYISGAYLEEACRLLGWCPPEELELVQADNVSLRAQLDGATADLASRTDLEDVILAAAAKIERKQSAVTSTSTTPHPFSSRG